MAVNLTVLSALIYGAMLAYLAAFAALVSGRRRLGIGSYLCGFGLALTAFVMRWFQVGHVPLQNLFEVFLCLGMLSYPLSAFCRRFLRAGGAAMDALVGFILLFPAAFVFDAQPWALPPLLRSWLFGPHVGAYVLAYVILFKASVQALRALFSGGEPGASRRASYELGTYRLIRLGFPLLTLGLLLGAVWGKMAWGDYWNWDPKELWGLVMWLLYVGYFQFRAMFGPRYLRINCAAAVAGSVVIVITLLWVNLAVIFAGLHSYAS